MATNEPMTTERIYEIDALWVFLDETEVDEAQDALRELLIEVRRLRAREQALQLQLDAMSSLLLDVQHDCVAARQEADAMRPIVEAVASHQAFPGAHSGLYMCLFCTGAAGRIADIQHDANCLAEQARAFVAAHPATDTDTTTGEE